MHLRDGRKISRQGAEQLLQFVLGAVHVALHRSQGQVWIAVGLIFPDGVASGELSSGSAGAEVPERPFTEPRRSASDAGFPASTLIPAKDSVKSYC